ncbi:MAG: hypothetical protein AAB409_00975 [Gemmatimonadota bacterium]
MRPRSDVADFDTIFSRELGLIQGRRTAAGRTDSAGPFAPSHAFDLRLVGLALSGGGIRSACFNLGLLQALGKRGVLARADYLSTVSGGGYIGSCLSSLLAQGEASVEPGPKFPFSFDRVDENPAIKHLRRHGEYLALRRGPLRLDTWRLVSAYLGGLLISLGTVLLLLAAASGVMVWLYQGGFFLLQLRRGATAALARADAASFLAKPESFAGPLFVPALVVLALWALMGLVYVAVKLEPSLWKLGFRRTVGRIQGGLLAVAAFLAVAGALPFLMLYVSRLHATLGAALASAGLVSSLSLAGIARLGEQVRGLATRVELVKRWLVAAGASLLVALACLGVLYFVWVHHDWALQIALASVVVLWLLARGGDINRISMFYFYRDRLSEAFVVRRAEGEGADSGAAVEYNDDLLLSDLAYADRPAPYHLVNTCVNLPGSKVAELRDRKADFFLLSPLFCGSGATGYVPTKSYERGRVRAAERRGIRLAWAMAVSGAAANPQLGTRTKPALAFLLAMLNARLGVWVQNPRIEPSRRYGEAGTRALWPYYLLRELVGAADERRALINLSDGGHIENLGVYELLRRRCRVIIASDASADPGGSFQDLGNVIRMARIDLGVQIVLDLDPIRRGLAHAVVGKVLYPRRDGEEMDEGVLVYVKSALTATDPEDLHAYRRSHAAFPHETTVDQFFDEAQFESYRQLGYESGKAVAAAWQGGRG